MSQRASQGRPERPAVPLADEGRPAALAEVAHADAPPDVGQLEDEALPEVSFPAARGLPFRIFFSAEVHRALWEHAGESLGAEVCGVLVGRWYRDEIGPYLSISASIRGEAAQSKFAEVTFTHATWARINEEMDRQYTDLRIVGWYHTHPDFGVFLSDRDLFIQQHFFSGPGQVAHVIDPVRRVEGVFTWRDGRAVLAPFFWVGEEIKSGTSAENSAPETSGPRPEPVPAARPRPPWALDSWLGYVLAALIGLLLALNLVGWRSNWEQNRLIEGTVAHYGIWKGMRPGLGEDLAQIEDRVRAVSAQVSALSDDLLGKLEKADDAKPMRARWAEVRQAMAVTATQLARLRDVYALSPEEARVLAEIVVEKIRAVKAPPLVEANRSPDAAARPSRVP